MGNGSVGAGDGGRPGGMFQRLRDGDQRRQHDPDARQAEIDKDTGLISYKDEKGNHRQINGDQVSRVIER